MKLYYYLLFRVFNSLNDPRKKNDAMTINVLLTNVSTLIIWFIIYTLLLFIDNYYFTITEKILPNKTGLIFFIFFIGFLNYMFFIKPKKFLNYGFNTDKKGGFTIVSFLIIVIICFVFIANKSRDKIFKGREKYSPPPVVILE
jgi:hypothetical protein